MNFPHLTNSTKQEELYSLPSECPVCHVTCYPHCFGVISKGARLTAVLICPAEKCSSLFLGLYEKAGSGFNLKRSLPHSARPAVVPANVVKISQTGTDLLNQAEAATAFGLNDLVGPGLRKALEFFIKDFLQSRFPDKAESIKKTALGNCVNTWVSDNNLKKAAERAVWLGNDETHYLKVWTDHDVTDLRRLIHLTINWIDSELTLAEYEREMPAKK